MVDYSHSVLSGYLSLKTGDVSPLYNYTKNETSGQNTLGTVGIIRQIPFKGNFTQEMPITINRKYEGNIFVANVSYELNGEKAYFQHIRVSWTSKGLGLFVPGVFEEKKHIDILQEISFSNGMDIFDVDKISEIEKEAMNYFEVQETGDIFGMGIPFILTMLGGSLYSDSIAVEIIEILKSNLGPSETFAELKEKIGNSIEDSWDLLNEGTNGNTSE